MKTKKILVLLLVLALIGLAVYGFKKYQQSQEKNRLIDQIHAAFDQSNVPGEFQLSRTELEAKTIEELQTLLTQI